MITENHAGRLTEAETQLDRMHRAPRSYGLLSDLSCLIGAHDYDGLCRADDAGRIVRNCLRPNCRKTQRLTPSVVGPS